MRTLPSLAATGLLVLSLGLAAPASAHGDGERNREVQTRLMAEDDTLLASGNVAHQSSVPLTPAGGGTVGISGCFMETAPLLVTSGLESVTVWDVSDGTHPTRVGMLTNAVFENEAMSCGERRTDAGTRRFSLIGVDLVDAAVDENGISHTNGGGNELVIVDVTDPADPRVLSSLASTTGTHTVSCVNGTDCRFAYSSGERDRFSIFDLRRLGRPREVDSNPARPGIQSFASPSGGHKWNFDAAGYGTHTGYDGSSIFDVSRPRHPRLVTTTGAAGGAGEAAGRDGYNDFIHHNSFRPNARRFRPGAPAALENGNVLLVTEEDYEQTDCAQAGSFQTWKVRRLGGDRSAVAPLDKVELADLGNFPVPAGAFCSAHWFDYRPGGIVAVGYYGGGVQLLDVRDPRNIRSFGYAHWFASEVWDAMWLPRYDARGRQTGRDTNVVYAIDLVRGIDVYSVDLPGGPTGTRPTTGTGGPRSVADAAASGAVPIGVVGGGLALAYAVRRRARRSS
ncbi:hypothetical protein [Nocardioides euryhalodurans]|uniref:Choice-of-anchor B family protein n=1 Tax=Nocardioides euryhalodurans TaxID=2518370 RepID=A0A4P7GP92_9ACTN|nr:hypothetical protein [Nocardioides euryhalodurans]QBR94056.1 hypothetical protein EXE57_18525 [Nocardioides euryhalodurans]